MIGYELGQLSRAQVIRLVSTLGRHRYVAGSLHMVHAFVLDATGAVTGLEDAHGWAQRALGSGVFDIDSKDERLHRPCSTTELTRVLEALWLDPEQRALERLGQHLRSIDAAAEEESPLFDETQEHDLYPVLIDAGWELLPLAALDAELHRGAIRAFDDFEVAKFEEENRIPQQTALNELPLFGAAELLHTFDDAGLTRAPFVVWCQGHEVYVDYIFRGVLKAAGIQLPEDE